MKDSDTLSKPALARLLANSTQLCFFKARGAGMRVWVVVTTAAIVGFGLTACVASGPAIFDREGSDADRLPNNVVMPDVDIDPDSVRLAGSHDGVDYYLAKYSSPQPGVCVVINNADTSDDWVVGCGGDSDRIGTGATNLGRATYLAWPHSTREVPEGWIQLNENLIIRPAP
jgi:hypothetical protein